LTIVYIYCILIVALNGAWRSLVAHLLWEQGVEGSNPFAPTMHAGVAQLARASAFQAEGRGFESRFPLQNFYRRL
jgi:hypothetical protein